MTKADFNKNMRVWSESFYSDTCPALRIEVVRKIVNCKAMDDFTKDTMLRQYMKDLVTNDVVVEALKQYNKQ